MKTQLEQLHHDMTILEAKIQNDSGTSMAALDIQDAALKLADTANQLNTDRKETSPDRPEIFSNSWLKKQLGYGQL